MKKNSQIHILIESDHRSNLQKQAEQKGLSLSEYCRSKLMESSQLDRIESLLLSLNKYS